MDPIEAIYTHIQHIRENLWCGREFGQAAVMIGTGLSRNADKVSPNVPPFPLWYELCLAMHTELYPTKQIPQFSTSEALKLASEYEITFSRPSLDALLIKTIPDANYQPGSIHKLLLSLPWSDIFTTNYDTLLEKTRPSIHDIKYDLISTISDIPQGMKPRIIKLHGSFPSNRPFIITEEDYRTYPQTFAPFVNTVQQSIMENTLCLFGFSGDDPNFLHWSGWVRDNLGKSKRNIYLIGILNLSESRKKVLEDRRVIPVDLSPLFANTKDIDPASKYAKALEWFLLNLKAGAKPNIRRWPDASDTPDSPHQDLPPILPGPKPLSDSGAQYCNDPTKNDVEQLLVIWQRKRAEYPGWVIAPRSNRKTIWRYTEHWIEPIFKFLDQLNSPRDIQLLYELNWRLERALVPVFPDWGEKISAVLLKYNPFPNLLPISDATIRPDIPEYKELDWTTIASSWVELAFGLTKNARHEYNEEKFNAWMGRLEKIIGSRTEWLDQWCFEKCQFHLSRLEIKEVYDVLAKWPLNYNSPFWAHKRASLLAELGETKEAENISETALSKIREQIKAQEENYRALSEEGWAMHLLKAIKANNNNLEKETGVVYRERLEKLATYQCNPWTEIEALELKLKGPSPKPRRYKDYLNKEIKKEFDPGRVIITTHLRTGYQFEEYLPAFSYMLMMEESGSTLRCGRYLMHSDITALSAKWVSTYYPYWAIFSIIRIGAEKEIKTFVDRVYVATLAEQEVAFLSKLFNNALRQGIADVIANPAQSKIWFGNETLSGRHVSILSELLSRICFRLNPDQLDQLLTITVEMYKSAVLRRAYSDEIDALFTRIFYAAKNDFILGKLDILLSLPLLLDGESTEDIRSIPKDPFGCINWKHPIKLSPGDIKESWDSSINSLINTTKSPSSILRGRAVQRLAWLYQTNALSPVNITAFRDALWSQIDSNTGLPANTGLMNFSFLSLPGSESGVTKKAMNKYLLSTEFPRLVCNSTSPEGKKQKTMPFGPPQNIYIRELIEASASPLRHPEQNQNLIEWTANDAAQFFDKATSWWNDEKGELSHGFKDEMQVCFDWLVDLLARVILPKLDTSDDTIQKKIVALFSEMESKNVLTLSALPSVLSFVPDSYEDTSVKLRKGLASFDAEQSSAAIVGTYRWVVLSQLNKIPAPHQDIFNEWVNKILIRRGPSLDDAIDYMALLLEKYPNAITINHINTLCIALEYLIVDTKLPNRGEQDSLRDVPLVLPISDRPAYRQLSSKLAAQVYKYFRNKNIEIPQILNDWSNTVQIDPLPEVKREWR